MSSVTKLEYYQTDDKVVVSLFEKVTDESKLELICEPKRLRVNYDGKHLLNTSLYEDVFADSVSHIIRPKKIEITLKKQVPSRHWRSLEDAAADMNQTKIKNDKWERLAAEAEKDEEDEGGVETVFKKIFKDADEDTRKAMIKSYTESKGTVLSTNWCEIGKKKTEIKPPDCMEYKEQ